ncbi:MDR family MFS transporter [Frigoribacterium sp. CFBP9039]|uniref:MDR family MFS transporter n=1 Tax=Frigoribacterium sp. CFBP9029 TaxID=3096541 RepID=UPI002A69A703|nr:MDR family MFS transporter [Frigoribacterium sp. CFBP9039]MDY0945591.1 MDR family MFS transporter [Frigoribacterium sp. CFBP9039]
MSHREVLTALSGLLMGMLVAILSSTVVSTSLPRIVSDLNGSQTSYTWVITATLLATTVSTPLWGKFSDLTNRKVLLQVALVLFVLASVAAGFSQNTATLITFRVFQGLGAGGLTALVQVVMSDIISPRERGRYMGYLGAVMSVGTIGGPLLGGVLTDSIGWRWNFFVGVPVGIAALIVIQKTLHLPAKPKKAVVVDYWGAGLIAGGVSLLLVWVSLGGKQFEWNSTASWLMGVGAAVLLVLAVIVEFRTKEPIIPLTLFKNRTFTFAVIASLSVGVAMFGTSVFLGQYMQLARGQSPTMAGILTLPMVLGLLISSMVAGALISKYGKWKPYMIVGSVLLAAGLFLMSTIEYDTNFFVVSVFMAMMGLGIGMVMQNLVLVVQNSVDVSVVGAASSSVAFFRSLGGTIGVSVMGAVLGTKVSGYITDDLTSAGVDPSALGGGSVSSIPDLSTLPGPIRTIVESAYGQGVADVFLIAAPLAIITIVFVCLLPNVELGTKSGIQRAAAASSDDEGGAAPVDGNDASPAVKGAAATAGLAPAVSSGPATAGAPTSPVDAGVMTGTGATTDAGAGNRAGSDAVAGAEAEAAGRHHAHTTTRTGTIDTIIATGAAEVAGHPVSDDELAESPVFSSLVEEKDVAADR